MDEVDVKQLFEPEYFEGAAGREDEFHSRIKNLALYLLEVEEVRSENERKQFYFLLEQLLREKLEKIVTKESKIILGCCMLEIMRLVSTKVKLTEAKSNLFYRLILSALKSYDEGAAQGQYYYLIENLQKTESLVNLLKSKDKLDILPECLRQLFRLDAMMSIEPGCIAKIQQIVVSVIKSADDQQLSAKIFPEIVLSIYHYNKATKTLKKQLLSGIVNGLPVQFRVSLQKYLSNILRERRKSDRLQGLEFKDLLAVVYRCFKINYEMMLDIIPYLEEGVSGKGSEERKTETIFLYGKLCSFRNSVIATTCPNVFKQFVESISEKKSPKREEMLQLALKFLSRFSFNYVKQKKTPNSLSSQELKVINCLRMIESKVSETLLDPKDRKFRFYAATQFERAVLQNSSLVTKNFFNEILDNVYDLEPTHKLAVLTMVISIYKHYCLKLHREGIFDFLDASQSFNLINGRVNSDVAERKEKAQEFQWLGWRLFSTFLAIPNCDTNISILSFNSLFFDDDCSIEENINSLLGYFYNIEKLAYSEYAFSHSKNQMYEEFLGKALGEKWIGQYENIFKTKSIFYSKTFIRTMQLKRKLEMLAEKRLHREGINENVRNSLDLKILKYTHNSHMIKSKEILAKLEQLAETDGSFKRHMEVLLKPCSSLTRSNVEERKRSKALALDYLARSINIENSDLLLRVVLCNETVDAGLIDVYIEKLLSCFDSRENESGPILSKSLLLECYLKLLLELKKVFGFQFSQKNIEHLVNLLGAMIKCYANFVETSKKTQPKIDDNPKPSYKPSTPPKQNLSNIEKQKTDSFIHVEKALFCLLKLASKLRLNRHYPHSCNHSAEELKELLYAEIKNNNLTAAHAKYGAGIIKVLDTITSKRLLPQMFKSALGALELKGFTLLKNINIVSVFQVYVGESDFELESNEQEQLINFYHLLLEKTVSLPRSHIISELTLSKKKLMKMAYSQLYISTAADVISKSAEKVYYDRTKFYSSLLSIVINAGDILTGSLSADREYMRINALKLIFEIISSNEFREERLGETLAKLSLCCLDNNPDIRKIMLTFILKNCGGKRHFETQYMALLCMFLGDDDFTINSLAHSSLKAFISSFHSRTSELLSSKGLKIRSVMELSAEFWIVYLFFIFVNNPVFLFRKMEMRNVYKILKEVLDLLLLPDEKNKENFSVGDYVTFQRYLVIVLHNLKGKTPVVHRDISESCLQFNEIKVKIPKEVKAMDPAFDNEKQVKLNVPAEQSSTTNRPQADKRKAPDHDYDAAFKRLVKLCQRLLETQYNLKMFSTSSLNSEDLRKLEVNIPQELYQTGYYQAEHSDQEREGEIPAGRERGSRLEGDVSNGDDAPPLQEIQMNKVQGRKVKRKMPESSQNIEGKKKTARMKK